MTHTQSYTGGDPVVCVYARHGVCVVTAMQTLCMRDAKTKTMLAEVDHKIKINNNAQLIAEHPGDVLRIDALDSAITDSAVELDRSAFSLESRVNRPVNGSK